MGTAAVARENGKKGGRPEGAPQKMSRKKGDELALANRTPLDVMVDNMNFWWDKSKEMGKLIEDQITRISALDDASEVASELAQLQKLGDKFLTARENAQRCAVDAAPYVHPRFTSITVKKTSTHTEISMDLRPAAETEDRSYRADGNVVKLERAAQG